MIRSFVIISILVCWLVYSVRVLKSRSKLEFISIGILILWGKREINSKHCLYPVCSEGLVHVSDPPLLSRGNFLDCGVELDRRLLDYIVGLDTEINELVDGSVRRINGLTKMTQSSLFSLRIFTHLTQVCLMLHFLLISVNFYSTLLTHLKSFRRYDMSLFS